MTLSRKIAAVLVLVALGAIGAVLLVPYGRNYRFQSALDEIVSNATNANVLQAAVVDKAASVGIPLKGSDVKVIPTANGGFTVDVVYLVRVDVGFYAVDLHFHPAAEK